jgi:NNP family nitrate/nitrite transporter-like MFS transporter
MTATLPTTRPVMTVHGHWIDDWRPEDPEFWQEHGARIARRNLIFSIFSGRSGRCWCCSSAPRTASIPQGSSS